MDAVRTVVRSLGIVVALMLVAAVSGTFADEINSGRHEGSLIQPEGAGTSWHSERFADDLTRGRHEGGAAPSGDVETWGRRFADLNSGWSLGEGEMHQRNDGIRDGYWLRLYLDDHEGKFSSPGDAGTSSTALPEPGSLLLLVTGVGPLLLARRRALKA